MIQRSPSTHDVARRMTGLALIGVLAWASSAGAMSRTFCISGNSTGAGWSWAVVVNGSTFCQEMQAGPVPAGADCAALTQAFIQSNNQNADCFQNYQAIPHPNPCCFTILGASDFQFFVGPSGTDATTGCEVTNNPAGCAFNPIITELVGPTATERTRWGMVKALYR